MADVRCRNRMHYCNSRRRSRGREKGGGRQEEEEGEEVEKK